MLAVMGILDIAGTTASGWLTDRTDPRRLLFWYYALRGVSLVLLSNALTTQSYTLVLFVAFYGLDWIATVPPTVALDRAPLRARRSPASSSAGCSRSTSSAAPRRPAAPGLVRGWQRRLPAGVHRLRRALRDRRAGRAADPARAAAAPPAARHRPGHPVTLLSRCPRRSTGSTPRLLLMLRAHPRVGVVEVARRLGVARGTVQARMDKLAGARRDHRLRARASSRPQMGYPVLAFVSLEIVQGRLEEAVAGLERVPEVLEVHGVTGDRDLLCRVVARDNTHLQDVINAMLHTGAVQRSTSAISMTRQIPYRIEPLIAAAARRALSA